MLNYSKCPLFRLKSKKQLKRLLNIDDNKLLKQDYTASQITPYLKKGKTRLIEPPSPELKKIQRKLKRLLYLIEFPDNVFSGVPKRSYAQNAQYHANNPIQSMFKIDLSGFFPSIAREKVYNFFSKELLCAPDIANILTNFTTVDIDKTSTSEIDKIHDFLKSKGTSHTNHLISGSPTSQILSYLVNQDMFNELQQLSDRNHVSMTIYVDDVTFSGNCNISYRFRRSVFHIIKKYNYKLSNKNKYYTERYPKIVTGTVIDQNNHLRVKNRIQKSVISEFKRVKADPKDVNSMNRLKGYLQAARQIDCHAFQGIYSYVYSKR